MAADPKHAHATRAPLTMLARVVVFVCGLAAVYFLPYAFAHPDPGSVSHAVHFNNHVAQLTLVVFAGLFALWTRGLGLLPEPVRPHPERGSPWPLVGMETFALLAVSVVWIWARSLGTFGEIVYFLDRYSAVALGKHLYRDIEFSYGPLLFYPQFWLAHALGWSFGDAHFVAVFVEWAIGIALIWYVATRITQTRRHAVVLFLLLSGMWLSLVIEGGLNYTPFRFLLAPALALAVHGAWRRGAPLAAVFGGATAGFWLLLFTSPEQAVAFAGATLLFFVTCVRQRRLVLPLLGFVAGCALAVAVAVRLGIFGTLLALGGGAMDFPLLPSLLTAIMLSALVLAACVVVAAFRQGRSDHPALYLIALSLGLLPAALGRCDFAHLYINLLPALAAVFAVLAVRRGLAWAAAPLCVLLLLMAYEWDWHHGIHTFQQQLSATTVANRRGREATRGFIFHLLDVVHAPASFRHNIAERIRPMPDPHPLPTVPENTPLIAPYLFFRDFNSRQPLPVETGYYATFFPLLNDHIVQQRIADLKRRPDVSLALHRDFTRNCPNIEATLRDNVGKSTFYPWYVPVARYPSMDVSAYCDYVRAHYHPTGMAPFDTEWEVWAPNTKP